MIYLASFKGSGAGIGGIIDRGIRYICKGKYSHSEICVGQPFEDKVLCVSSRGMRGGVAGICMRLSPDDYDLIPLPWVSEQEVRDWLKANDGAKYDFIGVIRFMIPFVGGEHPTKWFCSEVAANIIGFADPWQFNPTTLALVASKPYK